MYIYLNIDLPTYLSIYLSIYAYSYTYLSIDVYIYIHLYMYMYVPRAHWRIPSVARRKMMQKEFPSAAQSQVKKLKAQRKLLSRGETRTNEGGNDLMGGITRYLRDILGGTPLVGWFLFGKIPLKLMRGTPIHGNTRFYGIHNSQIMAMDINGI